jgi:hypothetical protein
VEVIAGQLLSGENTKLTTKRPKGTATPRPRREIIRDRMWWCRGAFFGGLHAEADGARRCVPSMLGITGRRLETERIVFLLISGISG